MATGGPRRSAPKCRRVDAAWDNADRRETGAGIKILLPASFKTDYLNMQWFQVASLKTSGETEQSTVLVLKL